MFKPPQPDLPDGDGLEDSLDDVLNSWLDSVEGKEHVKINASKFDNALLSFIDNESRSRRASKSPERQARTSRTEQLPSTSELSEQVSLVPPVDFSRLNNIGGFDERSMNSSISSFVDSARSRTSKSPERTARTARAEKIAQQLPSTSELSEQVSLVPPVDFSRLNNTDGFDERSMNSSISSFIDSARSRTSRTPTRTPRRPRTSHLSRIDDDLKCDERSLDDSISTFIDSARSRPSANSTRSRSSPESPKHMNMFSMEPVVTEMVIPSPEEMFCPPPVSSQEIFAPPPREQPAPVQVSELRLPFPSQDSSPVSNADLESSPIEESGKTNSTASTAADDWVDTFTKMQQGEVTAEFPAKYRGQWENGQKHGSGQLEIQLSPEETCMYEGRFHEDAMHGEGVMTWEDGRMYRGQFAANNFHGMATMKFGGDNAHVTYVGQYVDGFKHGYGTMYWNDPEKWEGHFVKGTMHGKGVYTNSQGVASELDFDKGVAQAQKQEVQTPSKQETSSEEPQGVDPAPKECDGPWICPRTLVEICRISADGVRPGKVRWCDSRFSMHKPELQKPKSKDHGKSGAPKDVSSKMIWKQLQANPTFPIWTGSNGKLVTKFGEQQVSGQLQCQTFLVWENGDVWRRGPTAECPDEWRVVDMGGSIVRTGCALKSPQTGKISKNDVVSIVEVSGRRARLDKGGWVSTCTMTDMGTFIQILQPDDISKERKPRSSWLTRLKSPRAMLKSPRAMLTKLKSPRSSGGPDSTSKPTQGA